MTPIERQSQIIQYLLGQLFSERRSLQEKIANTLGSCPELTDLGEYYSFWKHHFRLIVVRITDDKTSARWYISVLNRGELDIRVNVPCDAWVTQALGMSAEMYSRMVVGWSDPGVFINVQMPDEGIPNGY